MSTENDSVEFVRALARGLAVIETFDSEHAEMQLADVAKRAGVNRATARRLLYTLHSLGYVAFDGKYFSLKPKTLNLGFAYLSSLALPQIAQPFMEQVTASVQESCNISVLDGHDIVYVARVPTKRIMSIGINIGTRLPAHVTSMGRVLLSSIPNDQLDALLSEITPTRFTERTILDKKQLKAEIEAARQQGWAMVDEELEEGLRSIAVPIRTRSGTVVAALNISGHSQRVTREEMIARYLPVLECAASQISDALAAR